MALQPNHLLALPVSADSEIAAMLAYDNLPGCICIRETELPSLVSAWHSTTRRDGRDSEPDQVEGESHLHGFEVVNWLTRTAFAFALISFIATVVWGKPRAMPGHLISTKDCGIGLLIVPPTT
jgi:hypothetical protein